MQEFLPNTYPTGAVEPLPACPAGFAYLTSNGNSTREAGQVQLRRRLHNGLTATLQYTYSKSIDDDSALGGQGAAMHANPLGSSAAGGGLAITAARAWPGTLDDRAELARICAPNAGFRVSISATF